MRVVSFYTSTNSPNKKADATGAFIPKCKDFTKLYEIQGDTASRHPINCTAPQAKRKEAVLDVLDDCARIDLAAHFGHGLSKSIQHGFGPLNVESLAAEYKRACTQNILLFMCLTGQDPVEGFAVKLAKLSGARVFSHTTAGHATTNPYVRVFEADGSYKWLVEPGAPAWKAWDRMLDTTDLPYRLPFVTQEQLMKILGVTDPKDLQK